MQQKTCKPHAQRISDDSDLVDLPRDDIDDILDAPLPQVRLVDGDAEVERVAAALLQEAVLACPLAIGGPPGELLEVIATGPGAAEEIALERVGPHLDRLLGSAAKGAQPRRKPGFWEKWP